MQILIDYRGLSERLHVSESECFELLLDKKFLEKQRQKNPSFFIEQTDAFEQFFYNWRFQQAETMLRLENRMLDWDNEFVQIKRQNENTNAILGKLLPLFISFIDKLTMSNIHTDKLVQDVDTLKTLVGKLITGLADTKTANDELKQARAEGKANDETIDQATGKVDQIIADAQMALSNATADGQNVPTIGEPPTAAGSGEDPAVREETPGA